MKWVEILVDKLKNTQTKQNLISSDWEDRLRITHADNIEPLLAYHHYPSHPLKIARKRIKNSFYLNDYTTYVKRCLSEYKGCASSASPTDVNELFQPLIKRSYTLIRVPSEVLQECPLLPRVVSLAASALLHYSYIHTQYQRRGDNHAVCDTKTPGGRNRRGPRDPGCA